MPDVGVVPRKQRPAVRPTAIASARRRSGAGTAMLPWLPAVVVLVGGCAWLLARAHWYSSWTDDDAFISFRYARNLATGNGLVYNVGERTEGYTNFLWTLLLAVFYRVDTDLPRVARWLGTVFALATPALLFAGTTRLRVLQPPEVLPAAARWMLAALAPLLLVGSDAWAAWTVGGLESVLSAFLVTAAYLAYFRTIELAPDVAGKQLASAALLGILAILNHPSNLLLALPLGVHALLRVRGGDLDRRALLVPAILVLALLGLWEVWRLAYYGDWVPNTFRAKVGFTPFVFLRGLRFLLVTVKALPLVAMALVGLMVLLARVRQARHPGWLVVAAVVLHALYVLGIGGEEFPALRLFVVVLPLHVLVVQLLANRLGGVGRVRKPLYRAVLVGLVVAGCTAAHATLQYTSPRLRVLDEAVRLHHTALKRAAALRLRELLPEDTLVAHSGAGLLAYYTNFRWIDTLGLTDRTIARRQLDSMGMGLAGHEKGDGAYVWSRQPDYVMFPGYPISDVKPSTRGDLELFAIPEFRKTYRSVRIPFEFQGPTDDVPRQHFLFVWERIDKASGR